MFIMLVTMYLDTQSIKRTKFIAEKMRGAEFFVMIG